MIYLYIYLIIGVLFSFVYSAYYLEDKLLELKRLKATKKQMRQAVIITFVITFLIYPITITETIIQGFKKIRRNKK